MRKVLAGLCWALAATCMADPSPEVRGLWVVRTGLVSPAAVDQVVEQAASGGFNTLLVQVRGRGDAFYRSSLVSRSALLHPRVKDFDPLAYLMERARARQLKVHAWINVLLSAHFGQPLPADHILVQHPEWVMVPRKAARAGLAASRRNLLRVVADASPRSDVEGYYISPAAPGVPEHLEAVVTELLGRYAVDGLHLDFIRYPSAEFDYSRAALESFQRGRGGDLLAPASRSSAAWEEHRRSVLTALAHRLVRTARTERPGMTVSAAVVAAEADAVQHKGQAWPEWMSAKLLDAVCPMAYTPDPRLFRAQIERSRALAGPGQHVWAGVGAYRLSIDSVVKNIQTAREVGAEGVVLFSHESFDRVSLETLRRDAFAGPTRVAALPELVSGPLP